MDVLRRTWAEIELTNLDYNYRVLTKALRQDCRFLGVVKADAYGHGAVPIAKRLEKLGAGYLAVSNLEEALQLRRGGVELPILILGYTPPEWAAVEAQYQITQEVHDLAYGQALSQAAVAAGVRLKVHIKVDTGMSRLGFFAYDHGETLSQLEQLWHMPGLMVEGMFMHFAVSDTPQEDAYTQLQYQRFMSVAEALRQRGLVPEILHCANSGGVLSYPEFQLDMVRPGIATYGLWPSKELRGIVPLRPLMTLKTTIAAIRTFSQGITVSYGRTYKTPGQRLLAVCPIGYADGLSRNLSGNISFLLHGKRVPVVGRICMDMCMVDITDVPQTQVGDVVTVVGKDGDEENTWDDLADRLGTISYELVCGISKRVPRLYLENGVLVDTLQYIV